MSRRRKGIVVATLVILTVLTVGVSIYLLIPQIQQSSFISSRCTKQTATTTTSKMISSAQPSNIDSATTAEKTVGVFWYQWYGYDFGNKEWLSLNDSTINPRVANLSHWNSTSVSVVIDKPAIGYYASLSNKTLAWQISEMEKAGIDLGVISWWGTSPKDSFIDASIRNTFKFLKGTNSTFQVAIMVDAYETQLTSPDYASIYQYIYSTFVQPYSQWYFNYDGKPLLLWFNPLHPPTTNIFTIHIIGNSNEADLSYWCAPSRYLVASYGVDGFPTNLAAYDGYSKITADGIVSIAPRYDDYAMYLSNGRNGAFRFDPNLTLGMYRAEWNYVITNRNQVNLVLIDSWNEYHERTAIEPHFDATANVSQNYLLNLTRIFALQYLSSG
jgi:hypothetical protein